MKMLLILRHAKSDRNDPTLSDHDRPLNDRGLKTAPLMGRLIKREGLVPDAILSSPALRALQTAQLAAHACGFSKKIQKIKRFYPGDPIDYIETLQSMDTSLNTIMVVGHNPGLEELLYRLTKKREQLPTAALAHLELPLNEWDDLSLKTKSNLIKIYRP